MMQFFGFIEIFLIPGMAESLHKGTISVAEDFIFPYGATGEVREKRFAHGKPLPSFF